MVAKQFSESGVFFFFFFFFGVWVCYFPPFLDAMPRELSVAFPSEKKHIGIK
jgi:hypothetical protein